MARTSAAVIWWATKPAPWNPALRAAAVSVVAPVAVAAVMAVAAVAAGGGGSGGGGGGSWESPPPRSIPTPASIPPIEEPDGSFFHVHAASPPQSAVPLAFLAKVWRIMARRGFPRFPPVCGDPSGSR